MDFCIEDTRKKPTPKLKELITDGIITLEDATDWLRTIYEIRFTATAVPSATNTPTAKKTASLLKVPDSRGLE